MMRLSAEDFTRDPHAVKYGDQLQEHRSAFERLFYCSTTRRTNSD